jgi:hypothetical protein
MSEQTYTQYAVVVFTDLSQVVAEVNSLLGRGWTPIGGIQVSAQGSAVYHYQAVVKTK